MAAINEMVTELGQVQMKLQVRHNTNNIAIDMSTDKCHTFLSSKKWQAKATLSWYDTPVSVYNESMY